MQTSGNILIDLQDFIDARRARVAESTDKQRVFSYYLGALDLLYDMYAGTFGPDEPIEVWGAGYEMIMAEVYGPK